jgi:hypothetical protein
VSSSNSALSLWEGEKSSTICTVEFYITDDVFGILFLKTMGCSVAELPSFSVQMITLGAFLQNST